MTTGAREHDLTRVRWGPVVVIGLGPAIAIGLHVHWWLGGTVPGSSFLVVAYLVGGAGFLLVAAHRTVRRASFDGHRLRARTFTGSREVDAADLTELAWNPGPTRTGWPGRVGHRGGRLRVPMPAGAGLMRELADARPDLDPTRAGPDGTLEFDLTGSGRALQAFAGILTAGCLVLLAVSVLIVLGVLPAADTVSPMGRLLMAAVFFGPCAVVFAGWGRLLRRRVVRSAALDGARLRARTIDGREHDLAPSDVIEVHSTFSPPWSLLTAVRHPGGTLWISRPAGDELVQRLVTAAHPTRRSRWGV